VLEETKSYLGELLSRVCGQGMNWLCPFKGVEGGRGVCGLTNGYLPTLIFQTLGCERYLYGAQLLITVFGVLACNRPNILTREFSECFPTA